MQDRELDPCSQGILSAFVVCDHSVSHLPSQLTRVPCVKWNWAGIGSGTRRYTLAHVHTSRRFEHIRGTDPPVWLCPRLPTLQAESHWGTRTDVGADTVVAVHTQRSHHCPHMSAPGIESTLKCHPQGTWCYFTFPATDMMLAWPDMHFNTSGAVTC